MSAQNAKTALEQLDTLISAVESTKGVVAASASAPATTTDIAWAPIVPPGHTEFSWWGPEQAASAPSPAAEVKAATPAPAKPEQKKQQKQQKPKKEKFKKPKAPPKPVVPDFYKLSMVVGKILECENHPAADKLYIEKIDVGEDEPRQILSGLRLAIPLDQMIGADILVCANLKPAKMVGVMSYGMVLCAMQDKDKKTGVEFVKPPVGAKPGDRVYLVGGEEDAKLTPDASVNAKKKNHAWAKVAPKLVTDAEGFASYDGKRLCTSNGECLKTSYVGGIVS